MESGPAYPGSRNRPCIENLGALGVENASSLSYSPGPGTGATAALGMRAPREKAGAPPPMAGCGAYSPGPGVGTVHSPDVRAPIVMAGAERKSGRSYTSAAGVALLAVGSCAFPRIEYEGAFGRCMGTLGGVSSGPGVGGAGGARAGPASV